MSSLTRQCLTMMTVAVAQQPYSSNRCHAQLGSLGKLVVESDVDAIKLKVGTSCPGLYDSHGNITLKPILDLLL